MNEITKEQLKETVSGLLDRSEIHTGVAYTMNKEILADKWSARLLTLFPDLNHKIFQAVCKLILASRQNSNVYLIELIQFTRRAIDSVLTKPTDLPTTIAPKTITADEYHEKST